MTNEADAIKRIADLPSWAASVLRCPESGSALTVVEGRLETPAGGVAGKIEGGVARFALPPRDESIEFYQSVGGAHFHERSNVAFAMSSLDTPVYHGYLAELRPESLDALIVDVGGGDGRNALPWLEWGYRRVVVVDAVFEALQRFRQRVAADHPKWLERLLLVEADARHLPLADCAAERVQAIESLYYLNEDYEQGLMQCTRIMSDKALILAADRDFEGGLLARLFYFGGLGGLLAQAKGRSIWDGTEHRQIRTRCFTADEYSAVVQGCGLRILSHRGIPVLSLIIGYLHSIGRMSADDDSRLRELRDLLRNLGSWGQMRRCHVIVAERAG